MNDNKLFLKYLTCSMHILLLFQDLVWSTLMKKIMAFNLNEKRAHTQQDVVENLYDTLISLFNRYADNCVLRIFEGVADEGNTVAPLRFETCRKGLNLEQQLRVIVDCLIENSHYKKLIM